jgi:ParB-like chromosome segregation protein Spo0J
MKLKMTRRGQGGGSEARASPEAGAGGENDDAIPHYGSWGKLASARTLSEIGRLKDELRRGVREGRLAVRIPVNRIDDPLGSDRVAGWAEDPEFDVLLGDIRRRGQLQPIQVECAAADWLPLGLSAEDGPEAGSSHDPDGVGATRFTLIAGRRRLEACRRLGCWVLATVAYRSQDAGGRLVERFLENRMRADLSPYERLRAIGELAASRAAASDAELSALIGVDRGTVSRGRRVFDCAARLEATLDVRAATRDQILDAVAALDGTGGTGAPVAATSAPRHGRAAAAPVLTRRVGAATLSARRGPRGVSFSVAGRRIDDATLERALDALAQALDTAGFAGGNFDKSGS